MRCQFSDWENLSGFATQRPVCFNRNGLYFRSHAFRNLGGGVKGVVACRGIPKIGTKIGVARTTRNAGIGTVAAAAGVNTAAVRTTATAHARARSAAGIDQAGIETSARCTRSTCRPGRRGRRRGTGLRDYERQFLGFAMVVEGDDAVLLVNLHNFNVVLPLALAQNVGLVGRRGTSWFGRSGHFEKNLDLAKNGHDAIGCDLGRRVGVL